MAELLYRRVLVKLSGEALAGEAGFGIDFSVIDRLTEEIREVHRMSGWWSRSQIVSRSSRPKVSSM